VLIGVLGGGQLGRMLALAGVPLGLRFRFLDPSPYAPAGHVGELVVGDFADGEALARFTKGLDAATFEFENVPAEAVRRVAERVRVCPGVEALETGQDRLAEKTLFRKAGLTVHDFEAVASEAELAKAVQRLGLPLMAKTRRMGYDGKGQAVLRSGEDAAGCWERLGGVPLLVERLVSFERELSVVACRGADGQFAAYPLVENVHEGGILRLSRAPAASVGGGLEANAIAHARNLTEALRYVGVLAVEFFQVGADLYANEMAPRVHNSGHWTIDGAATSQFENHCRAVAGLPLGDCRAIGHSVMVNLIGHVPAAGDVLRVPGAHLHLYGKEPRPGRKVGHVTVTCESAAEAEAGAAKIAALSPRT
jgi:5-(carboxyamino)imidazole ribonucleotide synthase